MVEPLFTREHIEGMRPHIQQTVDSLLDSLVKVRGKEPIDLVEKFALPVPSFVSPNSKSAVSVPHAEILTNRSSTVYWGCLSRISITSLSGLLSEAMEVPQRLRPPTPISKPWSLFIPLS